MSIDSYSSALFFLTGSFQSQYLKHNDNDAPSTMVGTFDDYRDRRRSTRDEYSSSSRRRDDYRSRRHTSRSSRSPSSGDADYNHRRSRGHRHHYRDNREDRPPRRRRRSNSRARSPISRPRNSSLPPRSARSKGPLPSQSEAFTGKEVSKKDDSAGPPPEKEKPNFANTGRLAAESNTVNVNGNSVVLKYHEPPEARKPPAKAAWRLYVFKGQDLLEVVELGERSCWLVGRERLVVDFPVDHPSCSKQHAAIQFRFVEKRNEFGDRIGQVKPYILDLESANGTIVNGDRIPTGRYLELRDKDVIQFGQSSREYVLMLPPRD